MLTRVVAKLAIATKVTNKVIFLVEGEKFNLGEKNTRESSGEKFKFASPVLFELGLHTAWVSGVAFRSGFDAKYSRAIAFCFFPVHNHGFYGVPNTFCEEKHQHFHADRHLATKKELSININVKDTVNAHGLVDLSPASDADEPGLALSEGGNFFAFILSFFF